jgi:hypothetical protein
MLMSKKNLALIGIDTVELEIAGDRPTQCPQAFNQFGPGRHNAGWQTHCQAVAPFCDLHAILLHLPDIHFRFVYQ